MRRLPLMLENQNSSSPKTRTPSKLMRQTGNSIKQYLIDHGSGPTACDENNCGEDENPIRKNI